MADFGGGIPGQVVSELASIPKRMVETVVSAPPKTQNNPSGEAAAAAKRRLGEVRGELQAYFEEQKREEVQIKESKKKQEEKQVLGRLSRQYGGTGEVGKSGY